MQSNIAISIAEDLTFLKDIAKVGNMDPNFNL